MDVPGGSGPRFAIEARCLLVSETTSGKQSPALPSVGAEEAEAQLPPRPVPRKRVRGQAASRGQQAGALVSLRTDEEPLAGAADSSPGLPSLSPRQGPLGSGEGGGQCWLGQLRLEPAAGAKGVALGGWQRWEPWPWPCSV